MTTVHDMYTREADANTASLCRIPCRVCHSFVAALYKAARNNTEQDPPLKYYWNDIRPNPQLLQLLQHQPFQFRMGGCKIIENTTVYQISVLIVYIYRKYLFWGYWMIAVGWTDCAQWLNKWRFVSIIVSKNWSTSNETCYKYGYNINSVHERCQCC